MAISLGSMTRRPAWMSLRWTQFCLSALCAVAVLLFDAPSGTLGQIPVVVTKMPTSSQTAGVPVTLTGARQRQRFTPTLQRPAQTVKELLTQVSEPTVAATTGLPMAPTSFVLYATARLYSSATAKYFGSSAGKAAADTGGFTVGSTVAIPIYKYQNTPSLVNTTTHELTHAVLNSAGIGSKLPTWLNEGFAWYNGMQAERQIDPIAVSELVKELNVQLQSARQESLVVPLDAPVTQIIRMNQTYNVEFVDYLAVQHLITEYGLTNFRHFLADIPTYGVDLSFLLNFQTSLYAFETAFPHSLFTSSQG